MAGGNYDLPESLRIVADVIGRTRAMELAGMAATPRPKGTIGRHGRSGCIYVPHPDRVDGSRLEEMLGRDDAMKMARAFGGETLWLGMAHVVYLRFRDAAVRRMLAQGVKKVDVAWLFDLSDRQVRNLAPCRQPCSPTCRCNAVVSANNSSG
jgi:hypothetical protein